MTAEIVERVGDAELYERVAPELLRFATALVGRVDAPDVVSGAVVKALGRPEVRQAVARLSMRQRAVVVLTYWADLAPPAVAERLGISEGSVRRHLARARARLREVLDA
jgi:DNA-directed RNA polymerase specialized sigma24 family protein